MKMDNGGPAFPRPISNGTVFADGGQHNLEVAPQAGMTIRDYYAAHTPEFIQTTYLIKINREDDLKELAKLNFEYADAMIVARNKGT